MLGLPPEATVQLIVIAVALLCIVLLVWLFLFDIIVAVLNITLLYVVLYRAYFDLQKKRWKPYAIGTAAGIAAAALLPAINLIWDITIVVVVAGIVVELLRFWSARKKKRR